MDELLDDSFDIEYEIYKPEPDIPNEPLTKKVFMAEESISMDNGHAGSVVYYDPETHEAVQKLWVVREEFIDAQTGKMQYYSRTEEAHLPIPPDVTTTWELWDYIQEKESMWLYR